jgi:hypothetical protein
MQFFARNPHVSEVVHKENWSDQPKIKGNLAVTG